MGPNLEEQQKHRKKPAEHTARSQQSTLLFPESFPDLNFSGHSPWSTENDRKNHLPISTPSFLNDHTNIFHSIWSLQKKSYTWRSKQQEFWQKLFFSEYERRHQTNGSNSPISPILLHLVTRNVHFNFSMAFLSDTKLQNVFPFSRMTIIFLGWLYAVLTGFNIK